VALLSARAASWKQNTSQGESMCFLDPDGHKLEIHASDLHDRIEPRYATRRVPDMTAKWTDQPLAVWGICQAPG